MHIAKVSLTDLQPPASGIASAAFTTASELLAVSLARFSCAVVSLASKQQAAMLKAGLSALLANGTASEPGYAQREWRVGGPADAAPIEEVGAALAAGAGRCQLAAAGVR